MGPCRVLVPRGEGLPARGRALHDPLPLVLPLAQRGSIRVLHERPRPPDAAVGTEVQPVRPLFEERRRAEPGRAATLLRRADPRILPGEDRLVARAAGHYNMPMAGRLILVWAMCAALSAQAQRYDILITGAKVVDGTGTPWFYGDVAIRGDSIAAVGRLAGDDAAIRIDGRGMVVAPAFIDIHSHGRRGINAVPSAENSLREGVPTIIEGPDGSSPLPIAP